MNAKSIKYILFVFAFLSLCGFAVFGISETSKNKPTAKHVKEEVKGAAKAVKDYSVEQRDEAVKKAKTELDELDDKIETPAHANTPEEEAGARLGRTDRMTTDWRYSP